MTVLVHKATYQGYPVQGLRFRRSPGLRADYGSIDLSIEDFKELRIKNPGLAPYLHDQDRFASGTTIEAFDFAFRRTIALAPPAPLPTPGVGLFPAGDLVLRTEDEDGAVQSEITYKDIFIAPGGMEEVTEDLADPRTHSTGVWRIPVTDARAFWRQGYIAQAINRRLDGGNYDPPTTADGEGTPWTLFQVVNYFASQLPGSPAVSPDSAFLGLGLPPPDDVNTNGEPTPAVELLQRILDRYSLDLCFLPTGRLSIFPRGRQLQRGEFFEDERAMGSADRQELIYERKSVTLTDRPALVQVVGKRRIRAIEVTYVPIFQARDGKYYRLDEIEEIEGISLEDINKAVFVGHEKAFMDSRPEIVKRFAGGFVPDVAADRSAVERYSRMRELLQKWAYRGYGPAHAFRDGGMTEKELKRIAYIPVQEFAEKTGEKPEDFRVLPPQVYAYTIRQAFFSGVRRLTPGGAPQLKPFGELEEYIEDYLKQMVENDQRELREKRINYADSLDLALLGPGGLGSGLYAFDSWLRIGKTPAEQEKMIEEGVLVRSNLDFSDLGFFGKIDILVEPKDIGKFSEAVKQIRESLKGLIAAEDELVVIETEQRAALKQLKEAMENLGGLRGWVNVPRGAVKEGHYSLDRETGLLLFSELVGIMDQPFVFDREQATMRRDGFVTVRHGYEIQSNSIFDFTSVLYMNDGQGKIAAVGAARPSNLRAEMEFDPEMRLYEDAVGVPVNGAQIVAQGRARAGAVLEPRIADGFIYELAGFVKAVSIDGEVQHVYDGDAAQTIVTTNTPNARIPLGNARLKGTTATATVRIREVLGGE